MAGEYLKLTVEAYSLVENWVFGTSVIVHKYSALNNRGLPWIVRFTGCCKISPVNDLDSKDMPWDISCLVDLSLQEMSPRIMAVPLYSIPNTNISRVRWEREDNAEFPLTTVSFYVPAFHPGGRQRVKMDFANHVTTLSGTVTPIDSSIDSDTGGVSLHFPAVAFAESAQSDWSLPGVRPLGMFYFIKVNASISGATVQCDFMMRIELLTMPLPYILFGAAALLGNLPDTASSTVDFKSLRLPAERPRFFPIESYQAYTGFPLSYTVSAYVPAVGFGDAARNVGFGTQGVPRQALLSAVRGTNPAAMDFVWTPCYDQIGQQITCYEAVESGTNASVPECVNVYVDPDPLPLFHVAIDQTMGDPFGSLQHNMSGMEMVIVTLGALKVYTVTGYDINCQDSLQITIEGNLPPGAVLGAQQATLNPAYDSRCLSPSANNAVNRSLTWLAPPNFGGNISTICFSVTDECGGCTCAGGRNTTVQCVVFKVVKCRYSVGNEHQVPKMLVHMMCWCSQLQAVIINDFKE
uniref:Uncharacterized protein n=1 Tax=Cryptomonas curvata TaxID=233186 RepID=A0A7S0QTA5_9CRYP